jgi:hypothetical protein
VLGRQARHGAVQEGHIVYFTCEDTGINVLRQRLQLVSSAPPLGVPNPHSRGSFQNVGSVSSRQCSPEAAEQSAPIDINDTLLASLCLSLSVTFRSAPSLTLCQLCHAMEMIKNLQ